MGMPQIFNGVDLVYTSDQTHGTPDGPQFAVGTIAVDPRTGSRYMLCENGSATASAQGAPAYEKTGNSKGVMGKAADATVANIPVGPWMAVVAAGGFGWVQISGRATVLGSFTDGQPLYATADVYAAATLGTHHVSAKAREADDGTTSLGAADLVPCV